MSRKFRIVNSPKFRGDKFATLARTSRDRRTTVVRQSCEIFWRKNSHKIFQHVEKLRDQFATSSRHKKFSRHSRDTRTNVVRKSRDKIRKTVARNSHASEILAIRWKFCACTKFLGVHDVRQRMPAYCSVPLTYAKLMPNVCNVHQRMDKISHTSAYVGAIRCGVSTPLLFFSNASNTIKI